MTNLLKSVLERLENAFRHVRAALHPSKQWMVRAKEIGRSRRVRKIGVIVVATIAFLGVATYFAVPPILRHVLTGPVAASIHRPVTVGKISFNLYRLKLDVDKLSIGERDNPQQPFVAVGHFRIKVSWTSLFRLAPVIGELEITQPLIHVVRISEQRFNFSDLLESPAPAQPPKPTPPSKPLRYAVSNIQIRDGEVKIDDRLLGGKHAIEQIQLNVPFIANLPADVNIFVKPLLQMVVDGSPIRIAGVAQPFEATHDSVVDLKLHRLNLPLYLSYVPIKLSIKVPTGILSSDVYVHFQQTESQPMIRLNGTVAIDSLDVRDAVNAPVVALKHAEVKLTDVEPLTSVIYLKSIWIEGLNAHVVLNADGTNNLSSLAGIKAAPPAVPNSQQTRSIAQDALPATPATPTDFALQSFVLTDSTVDLTDNSGPAPAVVALDALQVGLQNFRTLGSTPAPYYLNATIKSGGAIGFKGNFDLAQKQITTDASIDQLDLAALQPFAQSVLAANIASGKLNAKATMQTHFGSDHFNLHVEPASVAVENFEVRASSEREAPVQWKNLSVSIGQIDLAAHSATVNEVRADSMHLLVRREHDGKFSLLSLMRPSSPPAEEAPPVAREPGGSARTSKRAARRRPQSRQRIEAPVQNATTATAPTPAWQYTVASVAIENTDATFVDESAPRPVKVTVAPLNLHLKDVSSDFTKPIAIDLDGTLNGKGTFKVGGTAAIAPLKADFRVATQRLDLAFADPYLSSRLNATIKSAAVTIDGAAGLADVRNTFVVSYRGDVEVANVRMLDKLTNDLFMRWKSFNARKIDFAMGSGPLKAHIDELALANFYSRIILNSNGKLNLKDLTAGPQEAPTSLTRATGEPGSKGVVAVPQASPSPANAPNPAVTPNGAAAPEAEASPAAAPASSPQPINADIAVGKITLEGGKVDYTDNFIKPNYTANLTDLAGKVGAFGTASTQPAEVSIGGQINDSAPINIDGSINPLVPMAFVDIKAKADGIELTGLTPYSTKYTGYPIIKGTLTVDVHYLLDHQKLTADNHIFIDQLTFGDHVESPDATTLPIRLAVSLLKNSKGQIDVRVPVSGSLSDPQFSLGAVIWEAFLNLIVKAATAPFTLIAAAFNSAGGAQQDLGAIEFEPGYYTLTPDSQKKLDTIAAALADRPALKLNMSGRVDPAFDTEGYKEAELERNVKGLWWDDVGKEPEAQAGQVPLTKEDYNKYLTQVYKDGKFKKPRDAIGFAKTEPPDEMKKLLITNTPVTEDDLRHLADARANAVRAYLSKKKVDPARMFVIAPKLKASGINDKSKTTRVDLSLE